MLLHPAPNSVTGPAIAVVGTGPSALYSLKYLTECLPGGRIVLFEAGERAGVGTPYEERFNPRSMLANIASIELPPVQSTLLDWLIGLPGAERTRLGITDDQLTERHFFPRMVLGHYFAAQLEATLAQAERRGIAVEVRTRTAVTDLTSGPGGVDVQFRSGKAIQSQRFDLVIVATGHQAPRPADEDDALAHPYREQGTIAAARRLGIIGTSLSAIDVAVAQASRHGRFVREAEALRYVPHDPGSQRSIVMLSRSAILPEADFYCPIPYEPLDVFTPAAVSKAVAEQDGALDRLFALFLSQLEAADPDYCAALGLDTADPDNFAERYFAARAGADPFTHAAQNLAEVRRNAAARRTVPWRYAILRMHERFGEVLCDLSDADQERFAAGLKRVFVDNYAAVPPLSIERLLALHRAGILSVGRLGADYETNQGEDGCWSVSNGDEDWTFDTLVDARGQGALGQDEFPFPTLRMQIRAQSLRQGDLTDAVPLADANALASDNDPLARVFCLALPFVMWRNPFVQGLTAAHDMGRDAAEAIAARLAQTCGPHDPREAIAEVIEHLDETTIILQGGENGLQPLVLADTSAESPSESR